MIKFLRSRVAFKEQEQTVSERDASAGVHWQALRFLVSGGVNTFVTYGIYLALLQFLNYTLAYTIAFVIGIAFAYMLNMYFVFRAKHSFKKVALFPMVYLVQYGVNVATLHIAVERFDILPKLALIISIAISLPITFLLSRALLNSASTKNNVASP